jgi:hypothetical protein
MATKLIAVHSIQTTDKDGNRVDVSPGKEFTVASAKEAGELIAAGAARKPTETDKEAAEETSSADGLPTPPAGYAPGTATAADVNADPNAEGAAADAGSANTDTATGEAAKGEVSTKSTGGNTRR